MPNGSSEVCNPPHQPPPGALLLTVAQVCKRLQISRPTFYGLLRSGRLKSLTIGRARRVPLAALEAFIAESLGEDLPVRGTEGPS
jgi:excisionase family DNA binding protein